MSRSGYYKALKRASSSGKGDCAHRPKSSRPLSDDSFNLKGERVSDHFVREILKGYRKRAEFLSWGGYKVLSRFLLRDHGLRVNAKKVYRLCREEGLLLPQFKRKRRKYQRVCLNRKINGPHQLWEFDIKQGCIHGPYYPWGLCP